MSVKALLMQTVDLLPGWGQLVASGGRLNLFNACAAGGNAPPRVTLTSPARVLPEAQPP